MGLNDLIPDDAGEAKGGRPKSRELGQTIEPAGEPFLPENDTEEWWAERIEDVTDDNPVLEDKELQDLKFEHTVEVMGSIADLTSVHPVRVRKKLDEHDIMETDWEEYINFYSDSVLDSRVPGYDGSGYSPRVEENPWEQAVEDDSSSEDENEGGLHNLL